MQKLLVTLFVVLIGRVAVAMESQDMANSYLIARLAVEGPYYAVEIHVADNGQDVVFRDATLDAARPAGDCRGHLSIDGTIASIELECLSMPGFPFVMQVDLQTTTLQQLEAGLVLNAKSTFTDNSWLPFQVIKRNQPFFEPEP